MNCKRCKIQMVLGKAIPAAIVAMGGDQFAVGAWQNVAPLVAVWKCPKCGKSITK